MSPRPAPTIRALTQADYPALEPLLAAVYPDQPGWAAELREEDATRDPKCRCARWVVEGADGLIAIGSYHQDADMYHPRKFQLMLLVHPDHRRQGLGTALYEHLLAELEPSLPLALLIETREHQADSLHFAQRRGFVETMREWESHLDVPTFDPAPFAQAEAAVLARGIQLKTLRELASDPERDRKVFNLFSALVHDIPSPEPTTDPDFDRWVEHRLNGPRVLPDAYVIAVDGDRYVGASTLWSMEDAPGEAETGLTGVLPAYRRQGIALALKLRCLAYAAANGYRRIRTWNATVNHGMLHINHQLGFVRQPAWIFFTKTLRDE